MELILNHWWIILIFAVVAFAYASVGLGGGSSYTALLSIMGLGTVAIPTITLSLNLLVTSIGSFQFIRHGHLRLNLLLPFFITSIPASWIGGSLDVSPDIFYGILLLSLIFVALRIYYWHHISLELDLSRRQRLIASLTAGAILGLVAGIVGIGGGIYLVPLILVLGLGTAREAAACAAVFTFANSASGLLSRIQHGLADFSLLLPLATAVIIGGGLGSWLGASRFSNRTMEKILGLIIIIAIILLIRKLVIQYS